MTIETGLTNVTFCAYDKPDSLGGPLTWLVQLLPGLREHGIESRCLFLTHWGGTGPYLEALRAQGFECAQADCQPHTRDRVRWLLSHLQSDPPDVFVPNLVVAGYFAARWVREGGIPTVGVLHSDDAFYRAIQNEFVFGRREFRVSALACVSGELQQQVRARAPAMPSRQIPYGVDLPSTAVKREPGILRLAYVGRLAEEQKQISAVTRALCRVTAQVGGTRATLCGDGPDRGAVEQILSTESRGLPISLAGRIPSEQIQGVLMRHDVLVLLSDYEGLPIAVLEAMACGVVPVCLAMRSGIPELVEDGVTGLVVRDREDDFVQAIARLQSEPGLWHQLSLAARARVAAEFTQASSTAQWADLLHGLSRNTKHRRPLRNPRWLALPPVNPSLASADPRPAPPTLPLQLYRAGRKAAGRLRRRLVSQDRS